MIKMYQTPFHDTNLTDSHFLVTGGAGFIGSNIVEYLLKFGAGKVRVLDNLSNGYYVNIQPFGDHPNFEFIKGDIRDVDACKKAMSGIHYVSHQAALGSVPRSIKDPLLTNEVNISGFLNVLTHAKDENSVKRMVYAASSSTYGDHPGLPKIEDRIGAPLSPYAVTKYVNELYADVFAKIYGFDTIGLRYFNVFGPNQSPDNPYAAVIPLFIKAAKQNEVPIIFGDGETSRDFTFVENVVQANIKALLNPEINKSEVINIACGESTSLNKLWDLIARIIGRTQKPIYKEERKGDVKHSLADISKARAILNYKPLINIEEGISKLLY
jgi:UDP-N-acetylglucosamine 4-epimerase